MKFVGKIRKKEGRAFLSKLVTRVLVYIVRKGVGGKRNYSKFPHKSAQISFYSLPI